MADANVLLRIPLNDTSIAKVHEISMMFKLISIAVFLNWVRFNWWKVMSIARKFDTMSFISVKRILKIYLSNKQINL